MVISMTMILMNELNVLRQVIEEVIEGDDRKRCLKFEKHQTTPDSLGHMS